MNQSTLAIAAALSLVGVLSAQEAAVRWTEGTSTDIPVELNDVHLFVLVSVGGSRSLWFLFDTGSAATIISNRVAAELELERSGSARSSVVGERAVPASHVRGVTLAMGGVEVAGMDIISMSLARLEPHMGRRVHGVLGNDFLQHFVFAIDYRAKRIRLDDPRSFHYRGEGEAVPLRYRAGVPYVVDDTAGRPRQPRATRSSLPSRWTVTAASRSSRLA